MYGQGRRVCGRLVSCVTQGVFAITCLKKLCSHPKLIYDTLHSKAQVGSVNRDPHVPEHTSIVDDVCCRMEDT